MQNYLMYDYIEYVLLRIECFIVYRMFYCIENVLLYRRCFDSKISKCDKVNI